MNRLIETEKKDFPAWLTLSWAWEQSMEDPSEVRAALARNRTFAADTPADGNAQIAAIRGLHCQTSNRPSPIWAFGRIATLASRG